MYGCGGLLSMWLMIQQLHAGGSCSSCLTLLHNPCTTSCSETRCYITRYRQLQEVQEMFVGDDLSLLTIQLMNSLPLSLLKMGPQRDRRACLIGIWYCLGFRWDREGCCCDRSYVVLCKCKRQLKSTADGS